MKWYRLSATQGYASAQNNLGTMYSTGDGVAQDFKEALNWRRRAAMQGNAAAQYNLGAQYLKGQGVDPNISRALMWLSISASLGDPDAAKAYDIISTRVTSQQIVEAQTMARKCKTSDYRQCD